MPDTELKKSLDYFKDYSLISQNGAQLTVHRLTQAVLHLIVQNWKTEQSYYDFVLKWLKPQLEFDDSKMEEIAQVEPYMFHASYLLESFKSCSLPLPLERASLLNTIGGYHFYQKCRPMEAKLFFEQALLLQIHQHDIQFIATLGNLGNVYGALGDAQKQKILLERVLIIQEHHYIKDHSQIAAILTSQ